MPSAKEIIGKLLKQAQLAPMGAPPAIPPVAESWVNSATDWMKDKASTLFKQPAAPAAPKAEPTEGSVPPPPPPPASVTPPQGGAPATPTPVVKPAPTPSAPPKPVTPPATVKPVGKPVAEPAPAISPDKINNLVGSKLVEGINQVVPGAMDGIAPEKVEEALQSASPRDSVRDLMKKEVEEKVFGSLDAYNKQISDNWVSEIGGWLTKEGGWRTMLAPVGALLTLFGGDIGKVVGGLMVGGGIVNEFTEGGVINRVKRLMDPNQLDSFALITAAKGGLGNDPEALKTAISAQAAKMLPPEQVEGAVAQSMQWLGDYKIAAAFGLANQRIEGLRNQAMNTIDSYFTQNAADIDTQLNAAKAAHGTIRWVNQFHKRMSNVPIAGTAANAALAPSILAST